jgi:hypothetical protein
MRIEVFEPAELTPEVVRDVITLVADPPPLTTIATWTWFELLLAYDWAMREHLRASDNNVRRRDRPTFTTPT